MRENGHFEDSKERQLDARQPVPAARPMSDFAIETVGDGLVILDGETLHYHTVNMSAAQIWRACDGVRSVADIAREFGLPVEIVDSTVAELGEADLLQSPGHRWNATLSRRRAAKLVAAGVAGAIGLPVITSITVPSHQAAATVLGCFPDGRCTVDRETCVWDEVDILQKLTGRKCTLTCICREGGYCAMTYNRFSDCWQP